MVHHAWDGGAGDERPVGIQEGETEDRATG